MDQDSSPKSNVNPTRPAAPMPPQGYAPPPPNWGQPPKQSSGVLSKTMNSLIAFVLMFSIGLNIYFAVFFYSTLERGVVETTYQKGERTQQVVILPIHGLIDDSTAVFMRRALESIDTSRVRAIVLRVDSGGGGIAASDRIWHQIRQFKADNPDIPIVASFGAVAASGGYYVASPADMIIAEPTCITGSIGVIAFQFTLEKLMEKIGVSPEVLVASNSPNKEMGNNPFRAWTDADRERVQVLVDYAYEVFISRLLESRDALSPEMLELVATGEVFTTPRAIETHLVDESGFLSDAIAKAAELGNIPSDVTPHIVLLRQPQPFGLGSLLGWSTRGSQIPSLNNIEPETAMRWMHELTTPKLMYQMR